MGKCEIPKNLTVPPAIRFMGRMVYSRHGEDGWALGSSEYSRTPVRQREVFPSVAWNVFKSGTLRLRVGDNQASTTSAAYGHSEEPDMAHWALSSFRFLVGREDMNDVKFSDGFPLWVSIPVARSFVG